MPPVLKSRLRRGLTEAFLDSFRFADNTGVAQLDQHCAVSKGLPLRLAVASATVVNMKSPNRFEVGANTGVVQVSRGVLHLESVP